MFAILKKYLPQALESVSTSKLEGLLRGKKVILLDVRTPQEYSSGHIKRARNVPLGEVASYQGPKDEKIYVICQSGMRSKRAAKILTKMGYEAVNVRGGMVAYRGKKVGGR